MYFLDTSALVKAYLVEPGSDAVVSILQGCAGGLYASEHVMLETLATFAYKLRGRQIETRTYKRARADFFRDYSRAFHLLDVTEPVVETAKELAHTHRNLGVGSVDLIHVATALKIQALDPETPLTIVCADRSMRLLARAAGFEVFDPETDDVARLGVPPAAS